MALGKLAVLVGAGLIGSVLTSKDGGLSDAINICTGTLKIIKQHLQLDKGSSGSTRKPNDALVEQMSKLRDELQRARSSERLIIVSGSRSRYGGFGIKAVIIVGVAGYIVLWWKGWKLSSFMFVTRRGFSEAVDKVAKQLGDVRLSIAAAKRHLTSRIDRVDTNLEECKEITIATKDEVSKMHGDLSSFHNEVESVHRVVQTLETKLSRIEGNQEFATQGVYHLCQFVDRLENGKNQEFAHGLPSSSEGALGLPPVSPVVSRGLLSSSQVMPGHPPAVSVVSRAFSLPPVSLDASPLPASPSAVTETPRVLQQSIGVSPSGLMDVSSMSNEGSSRSRFATGRIPEFIRGNSEESKSNAASNGSFGWIGKLYRSRSTQ